jgi:hypothetical protein
MESDGEACHKQRAVKFLVAEEKEVGKEYSQGLKTI